MRKMIRRENGKNVVVSVQGNAKVVLAQTVINNTYTICGKRIASVPVELMELDDTYQRVLGKTTKKLMAEWDNEKCDFLIVSYRNHKFYIIDGQHRYSVAKAKGIVSLPCIIFTGLTQKDEALKFAQQQDNVNKLTPYDTFKANIACGDTSIKAIEIDMEIQRICDKYGILIKKDNTPIKDGDKFLRSLSTARRIVCRDGGSERFELIIQAINKTNWAMHREAYRGRILAAINSYISDSQEPYNTTLDKLVNLMDVRTPEEIIAYGNYNYAEYPAYQQVIIAIKELISIAN